jgi:hypothetical protein
MRFPQACQNFGCYPLFRKRIRRDRLIGLPVLSLRRSSMQQFIPCNGCGNQIPVPELHQADLELEFLDCENCGERVSLLSEPIESPESETHQEFVLELELEPETSEHKTMPCQQRPNPIESKSKNRNN